MFIAMFTRVFVTFCNDVCSSVTSFRSPPCGQIGGAYTQRYADELTLLIAGNPQVGYASELVQRALNIVYTRT
jgi:hypothetical protein